MSEPTKIGVLDRVVVMATVSRVHMLRDGPAMTVSLPGRKEKLVLPRDELDERNVDQVIAVEGLVTALSPTGTHATVHLDSTDQPVELALEGLRLAD